MMRKNNPMYGSGLYVGTTQRERDGVHHEVNVMAAKVWGLFDTLKAIKAGDKVRFDSERFFYTVQTRDKRYIICTRPFPKRKTVIYTIIDAQEHVRGPDNMVFCFGYETLADCRARLLDLSFGRAEVSHRHRLSLGKVTVRKAPKRISPPTSVKPGIVVAFNPETYVGTVIVLGRYKYQFHSTMFHSRMNRLPRVNDAVEVVFTANELLMVREDTHE